MQRLFGGTTLAVVIPLRSWRLVTLLLAALTLTMESAHVLELPQKLQQA